MQMLDQSTRRSLVIGAVLIFSLAILRSTLLAGLIPPLHGPDEPSHFDYVQRLGEHGTLPEPFGDCAHYSDETRAADVGLVIGFAFNPSRPVPALEKVKMPDPQDPSSRATRGCGTAANYPPAYYGTAALGYSAVAEGSYFTRLYASRLVSALWGGLTAISAFFAGIFFFRRLWDGLLLGMLAVFQPMLGFLSAVVNNDSALFACATASLAAIAALRATSKKRTALVVLAVASTLGVLSKSTYFLVLPFLFVFCAFALGPRQWRSWLRAAAALVVPAIVAVTWALAWPSGTGGVFKQAATPLTLLHFLRAHVLELERLQWLWVQMYWMTWGWVDANLPRLFFDVLLGINVLAAVGLVVGWKRASQEERWTILLGLLASAGLMVLLYTLEFLVIRQTGNRFIQGRYLLPFFALHGVILILGLRWLGRSVRAPFSAPWMLIAFLAFVNSAAFFRALARYYA